MLRSRLAPRNRSAIVWALSSSSYKSVSSTARPPPSLLITAHRLMSNEARSHAHTVDGIAVSPRLDTDSHISIFKVATTLKGSDALQLQLKQGSHKERQVIVNQLLEHVVPLTNSVFGTHVIQQVLQVGSAEQKALVISRLMGSVVKCATDVHGYDVIEKAIDVADDVTKGKLISELVRGKD